MNTEVKTPWYAYYENVREHLTYPDISLYELLESSAADHLNNISYNYFGVKKNYRVFLNEIETCARAFKALGVKCGDVVSICMPNTPEGIIAFYALNKLGAIANMIHPLSAEPEISYYLNVSNSKYILTIDLSFNKINHIVADTKIEKIIIVSVADSMPLHMKLLYSLTKGRNIHLESSSNSIRWNNFLMLANKEEAITTYHYGGDEVAAILYSGGTTGYPKGIELTNLNFNALALQGIEACACLKHDDRLLAIMPIFHGFGLGICIHTAQYHGMTSILLPQFSAKTFDRLLKKYKPNVIAGVPTLYEALLKNKNMDGFDLSFLHCVISGGDSLSVSLKQKIDNFLKEHNAPIQVREGYGLTECVTGSCLTPMNYYREGSIGIPYPDTYYMVVKPNTLEELPYGEEGEIILSGPTVMKGYLKAEEETANVLERDEERRIWLHTGDLGYMDSDGFIYFRQRLKRVIMSSGYSIYPQYIENVIDAHPAVLMSCVIGIPHPYKVEVAKAFIVLKNGYTPSDELLEDIKSYTQKNIAKYSWPYVYEFREELPKTLVGKIAYNELMKEEEQNAKK